MTNSPEQYWKMMETSDAGGTTGMDYANEFDEELGVHVPLDSIEPIQEEGGQ